MDVDLLYSVVIGILGIILFLYLVFEFHYFVRIFLAVFVARIWRKKIHVLDETKLFGE